MKTRMFSIGQLIITDRDTWSPQTGDKTQVTAIEIEAEFPGGSKAWQQFLMENIDPDAPETEAPTGEYKVIARFIIDKNGTIADVVTETKHGYGMEEEVIKVLKKSPKWIPANQNGRFVNAYRRQPVTFIVY